MPWILVTLAISLLFLRPEWLWDLRLDLAIPICAGIFAVGLLLRPFDRGWLWASPALGALLLLPLLLSFRYSQPDPLVRTLEGSGDTLRFALLGDPGRGSDIESRIGAQLTRMDSEFRLAGVFLLGDNLYGNEPYEEAFLDRLVTPLSVIFSRGVPFYAALGSHDIDSGYDRFETVDPRLGMGGRRYYQLVSRDGLYSFFVIDSERFPRDPVQYRWLMESAKNSTAKWNILLSHGPPESSDMHHGGEEDLARMLAPLFDSGKIDLVVSGKNHTYERRARPGDNVSYVTCGSSGKVSHGVFPADPDRLASFNDDGAFLMFEGASDRISLSAFDSRGNKVDGVVLEGNRDAHSGG